MTIHIIIPETILLIKIEIIENPINPQLFNEDALYLLDQLIRPIECR